MSAHHLTPKKHAPNETIKIRQAVALTPVSQDWSQKLRLSLHPVTNSGGEMG